MSLWGSMLIAQVYVGVEIGRVSCHASQETFGQEIEYSYWQQYCEGVLLQSIGTNSF